MKHNQAYICQLSGKQPLADSGKIGDFTGVSSAFERPRVVDCVVLPEFDTVEESVGWLLEWVNG